MQSDEFELLRHIPILCKYTTINEQMFIKRNGISGLMVKIVDEKGEHFD